MSSYRVLIDQRAILCPYKDLREYSDSTPPLSYSVNFGGPYYYQLLEQPFFVPAGEGAVPYHRDIQLSSVGYASVRDFFPVGARKKIGLSFGKGLGEPGKQHIFTRETSIF